MASGFRTSVCGEQLPERLAATLWTAAIAPQWQYDREM